MRLISAGGGENDDVNGVMLPTPHLQASPYLRQVLASFGVVWSRSRLLRLAPGADVPEHADINYHWYNRVRLHIPVVTRSEVRFYCGDQSVHMRAGEAWLFDNWRLHRVENPTADERIHLVADTSGSSSFWQFVADADSGALATRELSYDQAGDRSPLTERTMLAPVMTPAEVDLLVLDLRAELVPQVDTPDLRMRSARYQGMLDSLCRDWRQLYALHGAAREGWAEFAKLRDSVRNASRTLAEGLVMRTNRIEAHRVLEGRVLRPMLSLPDAPSSDPPLQPRVQSSASFVGPTGVRQLQPDIQRPLFIVAAPRSGSTLLFETLAVTPQLFTLGGEAHTLVEGLQQLRPGAPNVASNRLTAEHATREAIDHIVAEVQRDLRGPRGERAPHDSPVRFLEKTPKNALRIPFFDRIFPDARYIFLWRDPRENLSSIIEAWRSGRWKTYNGLRGFTGPWSLLLPPGWEALNGSPLEEIAAFQWDTANRIVLDDLAALPRERWTTLTYEALCRDPATAVRALCEFAGIDFDSALRQHVATPLPVSRYALTAPAPDKWRSNQALIERVLPSVQHTWNRLRSLS
ncbi:MAG: sulfotransferase [Gammaproteobacteria bacterium]